MNARQHAKLSMYNAVLKILNENKAKIARIPALVAVTGDLGAKTVAISNTAEAQQLITKGITPDKNNARENLRNITVNVASLIYAYATHRKNRELQSLCAISVSDLKKLKDEDLTKRSQEIYTTATSNLNALEPYGVTNGLLEIMKDSIDLYSDKSPQHRIAMNHKKANTAQLNQLITEVDDLLRKVVDKIMVHFKAGDIHFYNAYLSARVIVDGAAAATQIKGIVADEKTSDPVVDASIEIIDFAIKTATDEFGVYVLPTLKPGTYAIKISKEGYNEVVSENIRVKLGKTTVVSVSLKKPALS